MTAGGGAESPAPLSVTLQSMRPQIIRLPQPPTAGASSGAGASAPAPALRTTRLLPLQLRSSDYVIEATLMVEHLPGTRFVGSAAEGTPAPGSGSTGASPRAAGAADAAAAQLQALADARGSQDLNSNGVSLHNGSNSRCQVVARGCWGSCVPVHLVSQAPCPTSPFATTAGFGGSGRSSRNSGTGGSRGSCADLVALGAEEGAAQAQPQQAAPQRVMSQITVSWAGLIWVIGCVLTVQVTL